jgi:hypothetical protein
MPSAVASSTVCTQRTNGLRCADFDAASSVASADGLSVAG